MKSFIDRYWRYYKANNKTNEGITPSEQTSLIEELSMTNDVAANIAKRLEFFVPEFKTAIPFKERMIYMGVLSILLTLSLVPNYIDNSTHFIQNCIIEFAILFLTIMPALTILDIYRPSMMKKSTLRVNLHILLIFACTSIFSISVVLIALIYFGYSLNAREFAFTLLTHSMIICVFTQAIVMYLVSRFQELNQLSDAFNLQLEAQNEIIKARMSPHVFFNTINGLISIVESNPKEAVETLTNVSTLFRASFNELDEIGFDQEVDLCKIFFAVDQMRFHGKLNITWDLPDEDVMYDMTITSLTLQSVLEKIFYHVVEMTTETINVNIQAKWENHLVTIVVTVNLPNKTLIINHDLNKQMQFNIQAHRLKYHFGKAAQIERCIAQKSFQVQITYPLHDPYI